MPRCSSKGTAPKPIKRIRDNSDVSDVVSGCVSDVPKAQNPRRMNEKTLKILSVRWKAASKRRAFFTCARSVTKLQVFKALVTDEKAVKILAEKMPVNAIEKAIEESFSGDVD